MAMEDINKIRMAAQCDALCCPNCYKLIKYAPRCPECGQRIVTPKRYDEIMRDRVKMVRAMETIARSVNDEEVFMGWLSCGVADEDITDSTTDEFIKEQYCDDETFIDLMDCFLRLMKAAYKSGGLFAGDVVSTIGEECE